MHESPGMPGNALPGHWPKTPHLNSEYCEEGNVSVQPTLIAQISDLHIKAQGRLSYKK